MHLVGNTHLVAGGPEMVSAVLSLLEDEGIETRGNPDLYVRTYQSFGIDEARELRARACLRATHRQASSRAFGARRVFVVATPSMTSEAQNALLKTLEEPAGEALFFFVVPSPQALLSTLRSRAQTLLLEPSKNESTVDAGQFLSATVDKRLDMLKPLLEKDEDDLPRSPRWSSGEAGQGSGRAGRRDLGAILVFLSSLEHSLGRSHNIPPEGLHALYRARKYIGDKGALMKPLLEQIALLIPKV